MVDVHRLQSIYAEFGTVNKQILTSTTIDQYRPALTSADPAVVVKIFSKTSDKCTNLLLPGDW